MFFTLLLFCVQWCLFVVCCLVFLLFLIGFNCCFQEAPRLQIDICYLVRPSVCLCLCLSAFFTCLSVCLPVCLSVFLSVYPETIFNQCFGFQSFQICLKRLLRLFERLTDLVSDRPTDPTWTPTDPVYGSNPMSVCLSVCLS